MKESGLEGYEYFAYISACPQDADFAKKLQRHLEGYKLPVLLSRQYPRTPRRLSPVCREEETQREAVSKAKFLIVICTETSAQEDANGYRHVDAEVEAFVAANPDMNRARVIPIIYREKGGARATACIPPGVKALDLLALDVLDKGYAQVCNQIVSRMVGIKPGILWNRWQRKARKNMAIAAAVAFPVLVAALVAIGGSLWQSLLAAGITVGLGVLCRRLYTTPRIVNYERYIEANNLPVGICQLTDAEVACRAQHYRFTYRGFRLVKVECCNSSGVPVVQQRPGFEHHEVSAIEIFYNEKGKVNRQVWSDEHGVVLREVQFDRQDGQDWVNFRSAGGDFAENHRLTLWEGQSSAVTRYRVIRNEHGHITEVSYRNTAGAPCPDADGSWGRRYELDTARGLVTAQYSLNPKGEPENNRYGIAVQRFEYDDAGYLCASSYHNQEGVMLYNEDLVATRLYETDAHGNCTKISYLGPDGKAALCRELMAEKHLRYDERGFVTEEVYYGSEGLLQLNRRGYARCVYTRNAAGTITEVSYFDENGQPCLCCELYHHEVRTVDEFGNCITTTYFDEAGKPCLNRDWAHRIASAYDADGQLSCQRYYDAQDTPTLCRHGYHMVKYVYDTHGNIGMETYYGTDEQPCRNRHGIACTMREFDTQHNCLKEAYYDENGTACVHAETLVASTEMEYDANHHPVCTKFYDCQGRLCTNKNKVAIIEWNYNQQGELTGYTNKGVNGKTCNDTDEISHKTWEHDAKGNISRYLGLNDGGTTIKHSEYRYDERGRTTEINYKLQNSFLLPDIITLDYDEQNRVVCKKYFNEKKEAICDHTGVAEYRYEYDERGLLTAESYFGKGGKPCLNNFKIAGKKITYNSLRQVTGYIYYGTTGKPRRCLDGYAEVKLTHDRHGRISEAEFLGLHHSPAYVDGYNSIKYRYDLNGNVIYCQYFDDGFPTLSEKTDVAGYACEYDRYNNKIREIYLDKKSCLFTPLANKQICIPRTNKYLEAAGIERTYDTHHRETSRTYINTAGEPCLGYGLYSKRVIYYNDQGEISKEEYFDQNNVLLSITRANDEGVYISQARKGVPRAHDFLPETVYDDEYYLTGLYNYYHWLHHYNTQGQCIGQQVYTYENKECGHNDCEGEQLWKDTDDYTHVSRKYRNDLEIEETHYDWNDNICTPSWLNYAQKQTKYDKAGRVVRITYYDDNGKTCCPVGIGYATKRLKYAKDGKLIEEEYRNEKGKLCIPHTQGKRENTYNADLITYARKVYTYDEHGNPATETYYGADNELRTTRYDQGAKWTYDKPEEAPRANTAAEDDSIRAYLSEMKISVKLKNYGAACIASHIVYRYNADNLLTEQICYHDESKGVLCSDNFARRCLSYDDAGRLKQEAYYNHNGELTECHRGYARKEVMYNDAGLLVQVDFYNSKGQAINGYDDDTPMFYSDWNDCYEAYACARKCVSYDADGNMVKIEFFACNEDAPRELTSILEIDYCYDAENRVKYEAYSQYVSDHTGKKTGLKGREYDCVLYSYLDGATDEQRRVAHYYYQYECPQHVVQHEANLVTNDATATLNDNSYDPEIFDYYAFISYSSKDVKFANKLQKHIEAFNMPTVLAYQNPRSPKKLRPIFRDRTDLEQGNLGKMLERGLRASKYLLVICSENSAQPNRFGKRYVDLEVNSFIALAPEVNKARVIPIIYRESADTPVEECIPPAVAEHGLTAIDMLEEGPTRTFNRIIATMTSLDDETLMQHQQEKRKKCIMLATILSAIILTFLALGGIYAGILFIISAMVLVAYGVMAYYHHSRFHVKKYERYVETNNTAIGIGELTSEEIAHRAYHYQFTYQGYRLRKIECLNSAGAAIDTPIFGTHPTQPASIEYLYNEEGHVTQQIWRNSRNAIVKVVRFESNGKNEWISFYTPSAEHTASPHLHQQSTNSAVKRYLITRNAQGYIMQINYHDTNGIPCPDTDGCYGLRFERNALTGETLALYYLNQLGKPCVTKDGIGGITYTYDANGRPTGYSYTDAAGNPTYGPEGFCKAHFTDENGNCTHISYLDTQGNPCTDNTQVAGVRMVYNERGQMVQKTYYNTDDAPCLNKNGICHTHYAHDASGRITAEYYENTAGRVCLCYEGYHKICYAYDDHGNVTCLTHFDTTGRKCQNSHGIYRIHRQYNAQGLLMEESYDNATESPCYCKSGYHNISYLYDDEARITRISYKGKDGALCCNADGIATVVRSYNSHGDCTQEEYANAENTPCKHAKLHIAAWVADYDKNHNKTHTQYFCAPCTPCRNNEGTIEEHTEYDESGRPLTETRYESRTEQTVLTLNEKGQCIKKERQKIARNSSYVENIEIINYSYDALGRLISESYHQPNGRYTLNDTGYARVRMNYTPCGLLVEKAYYGEDEQPISINGYAKITYTYDKNRRLTGIAYLDAHGKYVAAQESGVAYISRIYNDKLNIIADYHYGADGSDCINLITGAAIHEYLYDEKGLVIARIYRDSEYHLCQGHNGYAYNTLHYDVNNRIKRIEYFNERGISCAHAVVTDAAKASPGIANGYLPFICHADDADTLTTGHKYTLYKQEALPREVFENAVSYTKTVRGLHLHFSSYGKAATSAYETRDYLPHIVETIDDLTEYENESEADNEPASDPDVTPEIHEETVPEKAPHQTTGQTISVYDMRIMTTRMIGMSLCSIGLVGALITGFCATPSYAPGGIALALIAAGVWCICKSLRPYYVRYARYIIRHHIPEGYQKLSANEVAQRAYHYKFTYLKGRLIKVECCNSAGKQLAHTPPGFLRNDVATIELKYAEDGTINKQIWINEYGIILCELIFTSSEFNEVLRFRTSESLRIPHRQALGERNNYICDYHISTDTQGDILTVAFDGGKSADSNGTWGYRVETDADTGVVKAIHYLNQHQLAMEDNYGIASVLYDYDTDSRLISTTYKNVKGESIPGKQHYASAHHQYDNMGNCISTTYHAPKGDLMYNNEWVAQIKREYDERGFLTSESFYDTEGCPCLHSNGYFCRRYQRNAQGAVTTVSFFDIDGIPCRCSDNYHTKAFEYDKTGHCTNEKLFDTCGQQCTDTHYVHHYVYTYDATGNIGSAKVYGTDNMPTLCKDGYHEVCYKYNQYHRVCEIAFFNTDSTPCLNHNKVHRITYAFDQKGNCIGESFFNIHHEPCASAHVGVATICYQYDTHNNKIRVEYHNSKKALQINHKGHAAEEWQYDDWGHPIAVTYLTPDNVIAKNDNAKPCRIEWKVDKRGNIIECTTYAYDYLYQEEEITATVKKLSTELYDINEYNQVVSQQIINYTDEDTDADFYFDSDEEEEFDFDSDEEEDDEFDFDDEESEGDNLSDIQQQIIDSLNNFEMDDDEEEEFDFDSDEEEDDEFDFDDEESEGDNLSDIQQQIIDSLNDFGMDDDEEDSNDEPIYTKSKSDTIPVTEHKYNNRQQRIQTSYKDAEGNDLADSNGIAELRFEYNQQGLLSRTSYYGLLPRKWPPSESDKYPKTKKYLIKQETIEYDENGNQTKLIINEENDILEESEGCYQEIRVLNDNRGLPKEIQLVGRDGHPLEINGVSIIKNQYDDRGRLTARHYYNKAGKSALSTALGIASFSREYDANLNRAREQYYGIDGKAGKNKISGAATVEWKYDEQNREISCELFNEELQPCMCAYGYAKRVTEYDKESETYLEREFYNDEGHCCMEATYYRDHAIKLPTVAVPIEYLYDSEAPITDEYFNLVSIGYQIEILHYNPDRELIRKECYDSLGKVDS